jgi:penicillin-binding protein 1A
MSMRTALQRSRNLVSIRILNHIGTKYAQQYITRFGFDAERHPAYLPMALGAGQVTPLQMAGAYSVFANGGYRVNPYLIAEVTDPNGAIVARAQPLVAEQNAPRAIDARNAYLVTSMMRDVVRRGTGSAAMSLKRNDLAGKTGTTNDHRDAWFSGFNARLVASCWVGFDDFGSLGRGEFGAKAALPIWIDFMRVALKDIPEQPFDMPPGIARVRIDAATGLLAAAGDPGAILEVMKTEDATRLASQPPPTDETSEQHEAYDVF